MPSHTTNSVLHLLCTAFDALSPLLNFNQAKPTPVASQGHHPFAYALAELIDNSLRATRDVNRPDQPRTITISFVTRGPPGACKGLICVRDNGSGMTKEALNEWAVMNLSMEDRGQQPTEAEPAGRGQPSLTGAGNFLTGDLSYFGVQPSQCES